MFRFFRSIRQTMFNKGKFANYFGYAIGEIVLIVVGILLELQISESNQNRKDRAEEKELLMALKVELQNNLALVDQGFVFRRACVESANQLLTVAADKTDTLQSSVPLGLPGTISVTSFMARATPRIGTPWT